MDILPTVYGIFAAILVASGVLFYIGTIGLKETRKMTRSILRKRRNRYSLQSLFC